MTPYKTLDDLPTRIPIFPINGAILLPHSRLPLTIFEPRYLAMINHVLAGERLIGMIQPEAQSEKGSAQNDAPPLQKIGCVGRLNSFVEASSKKMLVSLLGVCRFTRRKEHPKNNPWRELDVSYSDWSSDLEPQAESFGETTMPRRKFLDILRRYLKANNMQADWQYINRTSNETLIDSSAMISPYGVAEKQAMLEAKTTAERANILIALTEMLLAQSGQDGSTEIQ